MFSVPLLRSHATVSLVDRDRLQLYHANRSVILVSSAIDFSEGAGLDKFIATIIAFRCLSFKQDGVLDILGSGNAKLVCDSKIPGDNKVVQKGNDLVFSGEKLGEKLGENFKVTLGDVISRDPATVGRSTVVLQAISDQWSGTDLVVKISWPGSEQIPENHFLDEAEAMAKGEHAWAANHLPRVFYAKDVIFGQHSTIESVAQLFENAQFVNARECHKYERRALRIIVQERLYPLKSLTNVRDIGQVLLDAACGTCSSLSTTYIHLCRFSSPLALRHSWDPSPRPQFQQYHVAHHRGEERQGKNGEQGPWGADGLRPFVMEEGPGERLHEDLAAADRDSAVYGTGAASGNKSRPPVQARCRITVLHHATDVGTPYDRNS